ncbi:MAG: hypothetical protein PVI90_03760 [Desulfobacteraceae bacterium]|jgi:predicted glycosyltransferase
MSIPRLDLLIYAHDGRGFGHASRAIAVAMAFRRLFPDLKLLFVSGTTATAHLIGSAPLDWIKLPGYATKIIHGKSTGTTGKSNFTDVELGELRTRTLAQIIELYRPRCVLVDHMPQGKHKELLSALSVSKIHKTRWVLGIRGIVGDVAGVWSDLARTIFVKYYHGLLWYGDTTVLGSKSINKLQHQFSTHPVETGYVSRMAEISYWKTKSVSPFPRLAGVVAVPWFGEKSDVILDHLPDALMRLGDAYGRWKIFIAKEFSSSQCKIFEKLRSLAFCDIDTPSNAYLDALSNCKTAIIYGGYNSLTDVLFTRTPTLVLLRAMQDLEQQEHLQALIQSRTAHLIVREEKKIQTMDLVTDLKHLLTVPFPPSKQIQLTGAESAAKYLHNLLTTPVS